MHPSVCHEAAVSDGGGRLREAGEHSLGLGHHQLGDVGGDLWPQTLHFLVCEVNGRVVSYGFGIADHTCLHCHTWFSPSPCGADVALVFNQILTWAWRAEGHLRRIPALSFLPLLRSASNQPWKLLACYGAWPG